MGAVYRGCVSGLCRGGVRACFRVSVLVVIFAWCCVGVHVVLWWCARGGLVVGGLLSCRQMLAVPIKADGDHEGAALNLDVNDSSDMRARGKGRSPAGS